MLCLRTVASLASNSGMFALGLDAENIGVAGFAGFVPGMDDGQCGNLRDRIATVMSVFPKALRDEKRPNTGERQDAHHKYSCDTEQMFGVLHICWEGNFKPSFGRRLRSVYSMKSEASHLRLTGPGDATACHHPTVQHLDA